MQRAAFTFSQAEKRLQQIMLCGFSSQAVDARHFVKHICMVKPVFVGGYYCWCMTFRHNNSQLQLQNKLMMSRVQREHNICIRCLAEWELRMSHSYHMMDISSLDSHLISRRHKAALLILLVVKHLGSRKHKLGQLLWPLFC